MKRLILLASIITFLTSAANFAYGYSGGTGESNDPYQIGDVNDLLELAADDPNYDKCFILIADINLDPNIPGNPVFTSAVIARDMDNIHPEFNGTPFTGSFEGAGHKISNLTINTIYSYIGLFGCVGLSGEVNNLTLENVDIAANDGFTNCGGLAGYNFYGTISNCSSTGTLTGGSDTTSISVIGGLVGSNQFGNISNCLSSVNITGGYMSNALGGLAGSNYEATIRNCHSAATVVGGTASHDIGGLVGCNLGNIISCSSEGLVISAGSLQYPPSYYIGGLVGNNDEDIYNNSGSIIDSWSSCDVIGREHSYNLGGLVGNSGDIYLNCNIINCYSTGTVRGYNSSGFGGLVGTNSGTINKCFSTSPVIGDDASSGIGGLVGSSSVGSGRWEISSCFSTGDVNGGDGSTYLGGLVGSCYSSGGGHIINCYSTSDVNAGTMSSNIGGLVGYTHSDNLINCSSAGDVNVGTGSFYIGGMVGYSEGGFSDINNCYFLDTSGPNNGLGVPLPDANMKQQASFVGWDFLGESINGTEEIWRMCVDDVNYPLLRWQFNKADYACPDGVNFLDFAIFADAWLTENTFISLDEDIDVDIYDLKIFCNDWLEDAIY